MPRKKRSTLIPSTAPGAGTIADTGGGGGKIEVAAVAKVGEIDRENNEKKLAICPECKGKQAMTMFTYVTDEPHHPLAGSVAWVCPGGHRLPVK